MVQQNRSLKSLPFKKSNAERVHTVSVHNEHENDVAQRIHLHIMAPCSINPHANSWKKKYTCITI